MHTETPIQFFPAKAKSPGPASDNNPIVGGQLELQLLTALKCSYCSLGVGEVLGSQIHMGIGISSA